jgi:hypothetical protein
MSSLRSMRWTPAALVLFSAELAAAVPVSFEFDSITNSPTTTALVSPPIAGSGDLSFDASGNLLAGQLSLSPYSLLFDVDNDGNFDLEVHTASFTQTLAPALRIAGAIDLAGGSGSATNTCTVLPAAPPGLTCSVGSGIAFGAGTAQASSIATLVFTSFGSPTDFAGTITWVIRGTSGSVETRSYAFTAVPEPGELALLAAALALSGVVSRRSSESGARAPHEPAR